MFVFSRLVHLNVRLSLRPRSFSTYPALRGRVYIIRDGSSQLVCTPACEDKLRTEVRAQSTQVSEGDSRRRSPSWICVDGTQLDLRKQFTGGVRNHRLEGLVRLTLKESAPAFARSQSCRPLLPSQSQMHSLLHAPASHGKKIDIEASTPTKPKPPGPEECCMSGCAYCVHDVYLEELTAYNAAMRNVKQGAHASGISESTSENDVAFNLLGIPAEEDMDPSTKAFLALERKLKNQSKEPIEVG